MPLWVVGCGGWGWVAWLEVVGWLWLFVFLVVFFYYFFAGVGECVVAFYLVAVAMCEAAVVGVVGAAA